METLLVWVGPGTVGLIVIAAGGWLSSRRKTAGEAEVAESEAEKIRAETSSKILEMSTKLREDMAKALEKEQSARAEVAGKLKEHIDADILKQQEQARINEELAAQSRAHAEWDTDVQAQLAELGVILPAPPPPLPLHNHQEVNAR